MANITELQFQGDSTVHKLNDARITSTAVTNPTHILTTNSDVTIIAPITASNLASVLGGMQDLGKIENIDLNLIDENSVYLVDNRQGGCSNVPEGFKSMSVLITYKALNKYSCVQTMIYTQKNAGEIHYRYKWDGSWVNWINIPSFYNKYPDIASLASAISLQPVLAGVNDNVFIMYHRNSDNFPLMVKPHKWTSLQSSGEIADGVVVVEGGKVLVVAPTEATSKLTWSSAEISGGGTTTADSVTAMNDWNGKANTTSQISKSTSSAVTNTESYAPGFCNLYSRANANGNGLTAGKWWLPSLGEMMMIYANMTKINYALSLISGATQLVEEAYWTSTEYSVTNSWCLYLSNCTVYSRYAKASKTLRVRAVSAFY